MSSIFGGGGGRGSDNNRNSNEDASALAEMTNGANIFVPRNTPSVPKKKAGRKKVQSPPSRKTKVTFNPSLDKEYFEEAPGLDVDRRMQTYPVEQEFRNEQVRQQRLQNGDPGTPHSPSPTNADTNILWKGTKAGLCQAETNKDLNSSDVLDESLELEAPDGTKLLVADEIWKQKYDPQLGKFGIVSDSEYETLLAKAEPLYDDNGNMKTCDPDLYYYERRDAGGGSYERVLIHKEKQVLMKGNFVDQIAGVHETRLRDGKSKAVRGTGNCLQKDIVGKYDLSNLQDLLELKILKERLNEISEQFPHHHVTKIVETPVKQAPVAGGETGGELLTPMLVKQVATLTNTIAMQADTNNQLTNNITTAVDTNAQLAGAAIDMMKRMGGGGVDAVAATKPSPTPRALDFSSSVDSTNAHVSNEQPLKLPKGEAANDWTAIIVTDKDKGKKGKVVARKLKNGKWGYYVTFGKGKDEKMIGPKNHASLKAVAGPPTN